MSHARRLPCPLIGNHGVRAEVFEEQLGRFFSAFQLPEDWQQDIQDEITSQSERQLIIEQRERIERKSGCHDLTRADRSTRGLTKGEDCAMISEIRPFCLCSKVHSLSEHASDRHIDKKRLTC